MALDPGFPAGMTGSLNLGLIEVLIDFQGAVG